MVEKKHFTVNKKIHFITLKLLTPKLLPSISRSSYKNPKEIRGFPDGSLGNESTCNVGDLSSIPGLGRSPEGEGMATHSNILAWRISMDRGAWWATVHGVAKSGT